jgi:two-component system KDP operon response regulator KdpE
MRQAGKKVLIVDDEQAIRRFLRATLSAHGYAITEAGTARQALEQCAREHPDLVILDLGLPDTEGVEVTRRIREWSQVPAIILSVREREADKVAALDAGADDYLTKPFGVGELLARLRVALRRATPPGADPVFHSGDLLFDAARRLVTMGGQELQLTPESTKKAGSIKLGHVLSKKSRCSLHLLPKSCCPQPNRCMGHSLYPGIPDFFSTLPVR